jgi:hypothetical protein
MLKVSLILSHGVEDLPMQVEADIEVDLAVEDDLLRLCG